MARRLEIIGDMASVVHTPEWRVCDAETGETIAGVYSIELNAEAGQLADIILRVRPNHVLMNITNSAVAEIDE